ncbi:MAG: hypothetical protein ACRDT0_18195, partial [Pseudonocardiaceae bacterium]
RPAYPDVLAEHDAARPAARQLLHRWDRPLTDRQRSALHGLILRASQTTVERPTLYALRATLVEVTAALTGQRAQ